MLYANLSSARRARSALALPFVALLALGGCGGATPDATVPPAPAPEASATPTAAAPAVSATDAIHAAVTGPQRSEKNRARDAYRHPEETLAFFGIQPGMHVIELWPGNGWYTEILAPIVHGQGALTVTSVDPNGDKPGNKAAAALAKRFIDEPALFAGVKVQRIEPPAELDFGPDGSADAVLTFRNLHDWVRDGYADKVLAACLRVLKPGGVLGVTDHRGKPDADPSVVGKTGYLSEAYVIEVVEKAGFKLDAKSEVNANPKDVAKEYPEGVWTLPPTLRLGDKDRDKWIAIGESDRMTLRFVKPK
jgi:predicted methyltransferase